MAEGLYELLGIDPDHPERLAGREDAEQYELLIDCLVAIRKERGLRQEDVARAMGTRQSVISDFERLGGDARYSTLQRYARAVGTRLASRVVADGDAIGTGWRTVATVAPPFHVSDEVQTVGEVDQTVRRASARLA